MIDVKINIIKKTSQSKDYEVFLYSGRGHNACILTYLKNLKRTDYKLITFFYICLNSLKFIKIHIWLHGGCTDLICNDYICVVQKWQTTAKNGNFKIHTSY